MTAEDIGWGASGTNPRSIPIREHEPTIVAEDCKESFRVKGGVKGLNYAVREV
jgi:hypothetical protein